MKYSELVFNRAVGESLKAVRRILEVDRNPQMAENVGHGYSDKYGLANSMTNTAVIAFMNILERLGLTKEVLRKIDVSKPTTLRFKCSDSCKFLKEQTVDVPLPTVVESTEEAETTGSFLGKTKKSTVSQVVKRVQEFHWEVEVKWEISVYSGTNVEERRILDGRTSSTILIVQSSKQDPPLPAHRDHRPLDVSLTWLLKQIDIENMAAHFTIDTQDETTKTPRRNQQVEDAISFSAEMKKWMDRVRSRFAIQYELDFINKHNPARPSPIPPEGNPKRLKHLTGDFIFVPVLPLMEEAGSDKSMEEKTPGVTSRSLLSFEASEVDDESVSRRVLSITDLTRLLNEQVRTLEETQESLQNSYPGRQPAKLISVAEASICVLCCHSMAVCSAYFSSLQYIEEMLENQLVAAIGKRVTSDDFGQFIKYHNANILDPAPRPFCHAIRRPEHYPEGILSIENSDEKIEPIETHVREVQGLPALRVPLNAATTIELTGSTYLHGWLNHRFRDASTAFQLIGRARQFSSFMLVVGTMGGGNRMQPKDAIILQNKDEIKIPLLLNEIPTAKEFKDAIESLSPEQQRFAKAYRSMQLEGSVLGIVVIQIKPQLENLLGLPHDALTKEIQLTQDLMELFVEYQVPSDLLSYDGENSEATTKEKVENVKGNVQSVLNAIKDSKTKQLESQVIATDMAIEKRIHDKPKNFKAADEMARALEMASALDWLRDGSAGLPADEDDDLKSVGIASFSPISAEVSQGKGVDDALNFLKSTHAENLVNIDNDRPVQLGSCMMEKGLTKQSKLRDDASPEKSEETPVPPKGKAAVPFGSTSEDTVDFTAIPKFLDKAIEKYDKDSALRSTTIKTSDRWSRCHQESLLSKPETTVLNSNDIKSEKDKAFDLLDALSRSGSLPIAYSDLHVIVCVTHCFEKMVMETVIEDNINPIEKLEMSTLLVASTIHGVPAQNLVADSNDRARLVSSFPALLEAPQSPAT